MNRKIRLVWATTMTSLLVACGGGSDSTPASGGSNSTATAEGVYQGTLTPVGTATSTDFLGVILENGDLWALYGTKSSGSFQIIGFVQGTGSSSGGTSYASSNAKDFGDNPPTSAAVTATFASSPKTINGQAAGAASFTGGPLTGSTYNYFTAANLSSIDGQWGMTTGGGSSVTLTVSASRKTLSGSAGGCDFSGPIQPRASGKNVFDVTLSVSAKAGQACSTPGSWTGVALAIPVGTNSTQLLFTGVASDRTTGTWAYGTRTNP